jgi:hypothetical protein
VNDKDVLGMDLTSVEGTAADQEIEDLRLQVRNLERLLGQRTLEIALLKERLGKATTDPTGRFYYGSIRYKFK